MTPAASRPRPLWIRLLRGALGLALLGLLAIGGILTVYRAAFGYSAQGDRRARMEASPQWGGDRFVNPQPAWTDLSFSMLWRSYQTKSEFAVPTDPASDIPVQPVTPDRFAQPPFSGLRVTWLGHSTLLLEVDGVTVLTDPVWGQATAPIPWLGPQRWYDPPAALEDLPPVDVVVISHDHYDHLDLPTIELITDWESTFLVPLGVGAHLAGWGVPEEKIIEFDWWERHQVGDVELVCTPSRHFSGRHLWDRDHTLWAGWAVIGPQNRVYFSGDTGLFPGMREIGERLGPFDLAMLEVGAYHTGWPDSHLGPEQAVRASQWVRGNTFLPVHWGLFDLAFHSWTEPMERVQVAAEAAGVRVASPRPGESIEFDPQGLPIGADTRWWPDVPWQTADQLPIIATVEGRSEERMHAD